MIPDPPKDLAANKRYRAWLLAWADTPERQREVLERCRADIIFWIDAFCWQYNPDNRGHEVEPFICYPKQEEVIRKTVKRLLEQRRRVIWRKSRKTGASWMLLYIEDHDCLFFNRRKFLNLSHTEDAVDRGGNDPDTLFWKIRFMNEHLPDWMTRGVHKSKLTFWFPGTNSAITGAATTERSGVGGRGTVMGDEFAKHRKDYEILGQTADTGPQLFCSTFYGVGGAFYDLCERPDSYVLTIHWADIPDRAKGLYLSNPVLPQGYEVLDKNFEYPPQCSACSGLAPGVEIGRPTPCCEGKGVARHYLFVTDGKPTGGPHPGVRSPWYDAECVERGNERDVAMHLDVNPQGSQSEYFSAITLRQLKADFCTDPVWRGFLKYDPEAAVPLELVADEDGPIKLWVRPKSANSVPASKYGAGCDLSTGEGATPSVLTIGDAATGQKVLEYADSTLRPDKFAAVAVALCRLFRQEDGTPALLAWEENGPGKTFGKTVLASGFRNFTTRDSEQMFRPGGKSKIPGWWNRPETLRLLLDSYKGALYNRKFVNRSEKAIEECSCYRYAEGSGNVENSKAVTNDKPEEARVNHGDRPMADALCWMALEMLGAGKSAAAKAEEEPPPQGSLAWRRERRARQRREEQAWA